MPNWTFAIIVVASACGSSPPAKPAPPPPTSPVPAPPCDKLDIEGRWVLDAMAPGEVHAFFVTFEAKPGGGRLELPPELDSSLTVFGENEASGSLTRAEVLALCARADVTEIKPMPPVKPLAKPR